MPGEENGVQAGCLIGFGGGVWENTSIWILIEREPFAAPKLPGDTPERRNGKQDLIGR